MNWFKKSTKTVDTTSNVEYHTTMETDQGANENVDEWVWVEGYKGTNEDMTAFNDFQYELNTFYEANGEIETCKNGFHLCLELADVFKYYPWLDNETRRYFKVKALVRKADKDTYGGFRCRIGAIDKIAAKQIVLTEEITEDQMLIDAIQEYHHITINSLDEYHQMRKSGYVSYHANSLMSKLTGKYSEAFKLVLSDVLRDTYNDTDDYVRVLEHKVAEAVAYYEEGVSKDIAVYLLMKDL